MYMLYTRKNENTFYPQNYWFHDLTTLAIVPYSTEHILQHINLTSFSTSRDSRSAQGQDKKDIRIMFSSFFCFP